VQLKNYNDTIDWLFKQFPSYQNIGASAYKPGLDNVKQLMQAFDNPQEDLDFIHIAGSNGKGSTASMLASIYTEANFKVGLFTSPHLLDFRERIRVNGQVIDEQTVIAFCNTVRNRKWDIQPSFFEITLCLALLHFKKEKCDLCILETGLGGRLDATNVVTPRLSIITNISLEHTQFLGNTLEEIAFEKGGIVKENISVVIGNMTKEVHTVFDRITQERKSKKILAERKKTEFNIPLLGDYQKDNFACVLSSLEELQPNYTVSDQQIASGLDRLTRNTGFKARLQVVEQNPRVIYDVSHNPEGIQKTLDFFSSEIASNKLLIVYGTSADKNLDEIFDLFPKNIRYFMTEFSNSRSARHEQLNEKSNKFKLDSTFFPDPKAALSKAKQLADKDNTILVFGSFFMIHDVL
jgi:dihydrofolate synthase/folylpolyglutamate synthase